MTIAIQAGVQEQGYPGLDQRIGRGVKANPATNRGGRLADIFRNKPMMMPC
jgi:hypothetical protein